MVSQSEVPDIVNVQSDLVNQTIDSDYNKFLKLLYIDQCEKDIGNILKSTFLSCQYTDEGLADKEEFDNKLKTQKMYISKKTQEKLYSLICNKKSTDKVSFIKIKQLADFLNQNLKTFRVDEYHAKDLMYGKLTSKLHS